MTGTYDWFFSGAAERVEAVFPALLVGISRDRIPDYAANLLRGMRLRDMWFEDHDGTLVIAVYTRTGGSNREDHQDEIDILRSHPGYREDADDSYDETYARFLFTFTAHPDNGITDEDFEEAKECMFDVAVPPVDTGARWRDTMIVMKQMSEDGMVTAPPELAAAFTDMITRADRHKAHMDRLHMLRRRRRIAQPVLNCQYCPPPSVHIITA